MERPRRIWMVCGAAALVAAAGAGFWAMRPRPAAQPAPAPAASYPPGAELKLPAVIRASRVTAIPAPADGRLEEVLVEPGQPVYEGQLLGRIANSSLDETSESAAADLDRAQSRVSELETGMVGARADASRARADAVRARSEADRVEKTYLRQQTLYREGAAPRLAYEKAGADFEAARKERDMLADLAQAAEQRSAALAQSLEAARQALSDRSEALETARESAAAAEILSPADGVVVAAHRAGEDVTTAIPDLFQIAVDLTALEAVAHAPAEALPRIRAGQDAFVAIDQTPEALRGRVKSADGSAVVVEFTNPYPGVQPGGAAVVRITLR
jgi:HlyD family secretion protein